MSTAIKKQATRQPQPFTIDLATLHLGMGWFGAAEFGPCSLRRSVLFVGVSVNLLEILWGFGIASDLPDVQRRSCFAGRVDDPVPRRSSPGGNASCIRRFCENRTAR